MKFNFELIKKHPLVTGAVIIVGGLILYLLLRGGSSNASVSSGNQMTAAPSTGSTQAEQNSFALAYLQQQQSGDLAIASLQGNVSTTQQVNAITGQENLAGIQEHIANAQIASGDYQATLSANTTLQTQAIAAGEAVQLATLETGANVAINSANVDLQKTIAGYQRDTTLGLASYQLQGIQAEASAFKFASGGNDIMGTIATVAPIALAAL